MRTTGGAVATTMGRSHGPAAGAIARSAWSESWRPWVNRLSRRSACASQVSAENLAPHEAGCRTIGHAFTHRLTLPAGCYSVGAERSHQAGRDLRAEDLLSGSRFRPGRNSVARAGSGPRRMGRNSAGAG